MIRVEATLDIAAYGYAGFSLRVSLDTSGPTLHHDTYIEPEYLLNRTVFDSLFDDVKRELLAEWARVNESKAA